MKESDARNKSCPFCASQAYPMAVKLKQMNHSKQESEEIVSIASKCEGSDCVMWSELPSLFEEQGERVEKIIRNGEEFNQIVPNMVEIKYGDCGLKR